MIQWKYPLWCFCWSKSEKTGGSGSIDYIYILHGDFDCVQMSIFLIEHWLLSIYLFSFYQFIFQRKISFRWSTISCWSFISHSSIRMPTDQWKDHLSSLEFEITLPIELHQQTWRNDTCVYVEYRETSDLFLDLKSIFFVWRISWLKIDVFIFQLKYSKQKKKNNQCIFESKSSSKDELIDSFDSL